MKNNYPITDKQRKRIEKHLVNSWDHIYSKILTPQQRRLMKKDRDFEKRVCFEMEDSYKGMANEFGLSALLDELYEHRG